MKLWLFSSVALVAAACCVLPVAGAEEPANPIPPAALATAKSVTVFPIVLNSGKPIHGVAPDMSKNLAELVGLFLERGGVKEIEIADAQFSPSEGDSMDKLAEAFGRFVRPRHLGTELALYGQFLGTPGKGVNEIRLVVVDRQGKVVFSERRDQQQLSQLGEKKVDPMIASYHLVCRLEGPLGLADPNRKDAPQGKMATLWAEKSALPPQTEQAAMKSRLEGLKKTLKASTIAVFPVHVLGKSDEPLAGRLAKMLAQAGFRSVEPASAELKLDIKPSTNQLRIAWEIARTFQNYLHKNPPAADYALLADYRIGRTADGKTAVAGVQFVLCDRKGDWVLVSVQNSHQPDFQRIDPQSPEDCNRVVAEAIGKDLR